MYLHNKVKRGNFFFMCMYLFWHITSFSSSLVGPMIIYEYCEHGPLRDYLQGQNTNITLEVQEQLFRFGLDIAKGMEYLASKKVNK